MKIWTAIYEIDTQSCIERLPNNPEGNTLVFKSMKTKVSEIIEAKSLDEAVKFAKSREVTIINVTDSYSIRLVSLLAAVFS
jgi:uncharacterized protein YciI